MARAFLSALGGLRVNQSWIDVIGNNLANSNTPGFKGSRALFSDLLNITYRPATGPTGNFGGTNPLQIGLGVQLAHVDRRLNQGSLDQTGRTFDIALLGGGYFAVDNGTDTLFTRVGAFGLDASGDMVDLRTGYRVLGPTGAPINIDTTTPMPPSATTEVALKGNLPAVVTGPLAEVLTSSGLSEGTAAATAGANAGPFTIPSGETWTMELTVNGGAPEQVSIAGTGLPITAQDVADAINAQVDHATATVDTSGAVTLTSSRSGLASTIEIDAGETGKDLKDMLGLVDFVQGTEDVAGPSTDLSNLTSNRTDYAVGDVIDVHGTDADGSEVVGSFVYGVDGTTVQSLQAYLDGLYAQSTVEFNGTTGQFVVTADSTGEAELSLTLADEANQAGDTDWARHVFSVATEGAGPDQVTSSVEVFDAAGTAHLLTFEFTRQEDLTWTMVASVPAGEGSVSSAPVTGITFNANGSIATAAGDVTVDFGSGSQSISLDVGSAGSFDGLTQFGNPSSVVADFQDGYGAGELSSISVRTDGSIDGFYSNGQTQNLGALGIATFGNEAALEELGDNYFRETPNTGTRTLGAGQAHGAGDVIGGAIEASNVDTAEEFVHMIEAQRGFQANARVITVQDELLSEIVNIV